MRSATRVGIGFAVGFTAGVAATAVVVRMYGANGFVTSTYDTLVSQPITPTKILIMVAIALALAAIPFGVAEWRADSRFRKEERRLRDERPGAAVREYAGDEGEGLLFEDAAGRVLLLRPPGGFAGPRIVELPPSMAEAPPPEPPTA